MDFDRFTDHHANWYLRDGSLMPYGETVCPPCFDRQLELPESLPQMILLAERLAAGIPFLRVDFYHVNNTIYSGELTFYPASGLHPFTDEALDIQMGQWLTLPEHKTT